MSEITIPFIERDISWLSFNYRVLQEAKDPSVPLFERIKFLAIYSSNLDEFFKVRMANHRNLLRLGKKTKKELAFSPKEVVTEIQTIVDEQQEEVAHIFENQILPELQKHRIYIKKRLDLDENQAEFVENYFQQHMLPFVQPVLLVKNKIRPFLNNGQLYLAVWLHPKSQSDKLSEYAIVKIPSDHLPRFIELPSSTDEHHLIMLDDIVRHSVSWMFPGYDILDAYSIKLTRDAELYIDDEFTGDLLAKIKAGLAKRHVGPASRFVYDGEMPDEILEYLCDMFDLTRYDILKEGRYHNNFDFFQFPNFGMHHLKDQALAPLSYSSLEDTADFYGQLRDRDHLVQFPYHSYESTIRFFEEAAKDSKVTHIKIVQYRVARKSRIMNALINAVKSGKQVSVFIEVKARFDEEANLRWGEKLEKAGVTVNYSFPGVKVHSKLALIRRIDEDGPRMYSYLSTGNFHEVTATIYSDFGLFTADPRLVNEVARVFSYLETAKPLGTPFRHLLVGQFNLRESLERKIEYEIKEAKAGKKAWMILKMNSLQDQKMIKKLYEASNAGVKIQLIIRGICCLIPGEEGWSENIEAISIVDRYLEHARVFVFHHGGEDQTYLSSADWMERNLSYRIETTFPVYDPILKEEIRASLRHQLADNVKARILDENLQNNYAKSTSDLALRSQVETYFYTKRKLDEEGGNNLIVDA